MLPTIESSRESHHCTNQQLEITI